jgi:hypothetical protein
MNSIFVMLLLTTQGVYEVQTFPTMRACLESSTQIKKAETLCVERKPVDPSLEVQKMMRTFRSLRDALEKEL